MASIREYQLADGSVKYAVRWVAVDGSTRSQTEDTPARARAVKQEVERTLRQTRADARREGVSVMAANKTFREVAEEWLSTIPRMSTRDGHQRRLKHVYPVIGDRPLRDIPPADVVKLTKSWVSLAPSTRVATFTTVRAVFSWGEGQRVITKDDNPCNSDLVRRQQPKMPDAQLPDAWPREWIRNVKREIRQDVQPAAWLAAHLGLRQGECFGISFDDFILKNDGRRFFRVRRQVIRRDDNSLVFGPPKHRVEEDDPREVPVPDFLWEFLQDYATAHPPMPVTLPWDHGDGRPLEMRTYDLIMTTREGGAWSRNYFNNKVWKPLLRSLDIPDTNQNGMHSLRHWFACNALANGAGLARVGIWLGHKSEAFTLKAYKRFDIQGTEDVIARIDADARDMMGE